MNLLIITPRIPYPPYRGDKLKIFNLVRQLVKSNSVTIITFLRNKKQLIEIDELKKYGFNIIYIKISLLESYLSVLQSLFTNLPFQVAWYRSKKMERKINELLTSRNYDVAYFHLIRSAQYYPEQSKIQPLLKVLDFTDAVSLYLNRFFRIEKNFIKKVILQIEKRRVEKYEKIAEKFHLVFTCSEVDKKYLVNKGVVANFKILKNGVDIDYFKSDQVLVNPNRIIFTGNMPYYANYDAAIYFVNEIFPHILKDFPNAEFYIVGQNPPRKIRALSSNNIFVTGFVKDIREEYLKSVVNVAPMRFGAGTLNKIIESIVLGIPVVATSIAVEGLPDELKTYIQVAEKPEEFANCVLKLLRSRELREKIIKVDKSTIRKILSWESVVSKLELDLNEELNKLKR